MTASAAPEAETGTQDEMTGVRKVAILLMSLDGDRAGRLLRELDADEITEIVTELEQLQHLPGDTVDEVIADFARTAAQQRGDLRGGSGYIRKLLVTSL